MAIECMFTVAADRKILTPEFYEKCVAHSAETKQPLLIEPDGSDHTLFAEPWNLPGRVSYTLRLDKSYDEENPDMLDWSWERFFREKGYDEPDFFGLITDQCWPQFEDLTWSDEDEQVIERKKREKAKEILVQQADVDFLWEEYKSWGSPKGKAYYFLFDLDLGPRNRRGEGVGSVSFIDSPSLGYYECSVEVGDDVSLSLLQARLIELGKNVSISIESSIY